MCSSWRQGAESAPPISGAHLTCWETPAKSHTQWSPGPQTALPLLASSLLSDLDPAVAMEPGPKALLETQMPVEVTAAPGLTGPLSRPLENRPEPKRSPLKAAAGKVGPSGTSPLFPWLVWLPVGCQTNTQRCGRELHLLASS